MHWTYFKSEVLKYIYSNRDVSRCDDACFICSLTERNLKINYRNNVFFSEMWK